MSLPDTMAMAAGDHAAEIAAAGGLLLIDLDALAHNYQLIASRVPGAATAAIVKANAYGLGIGPVSRRLWAEGCRHYFVAEAAEGRDLRKILPEAVIYVLNGLFPAAASFYSAYGLRPCLGSLAELADWAAEAKRLGKDLPAALHFDTGLTRLGIPESDAGLIAASPDLLKGVDITLVMSHLACADEPDHPMNERQRLAFEALRAQLPDDLRAKPASLANSGGAFLGTAFQYDLVRPGIGLYGGNPFSDRANPFRPVVRAQARVLQVRAARDGAGVGYGATYRVAGRQRLAILSVGYADGYFRSLSRPALVSNETAPGGGVFIGGVFAPVAGRISMDMLTIDVTHVPEGIIRRGDLAELIGPNINLDDVGLRAGTIGYEILTSLGQRYMRIYQSGGTITHGDRA